MRVPTLERCASLAKSRAIRRRGSETQMKSDNLDILIPVYDPGKRIIDLLSSLAICSKHLSSTLHLHISDDCSPNFSASELEQVPWSSRFVLHYYRNTRNLNECSNVNDAVNRLRAEGREWF